MMGIEKDFDELYHHAKTIGILSSIAELLDWDQNVMMPKNASFLRAEQFATLSGVSHELFIDTKTNVLITAVEKNQDFKTLSSAQQFLVLELRRTYNRAVAVSKVIVEKIASTASKANQLWIDARKENDFSLFAPVLEEIITLKKEYAKQVNPNAHPYEVIMHDLEPDFSLEEVTVFLSRIKEGILRFLPKALEKQQGTKPDVSIFSDHVAQATQETFLRELLARMGYDFSKGRLDTSVHPFSASYGRITTRFSDKWLFALLSSMHEMGHAFYEHGLPTKHRGTPLGEPCSYAVHESQSRLWENMICRSESFVEWFFPQLQKAYAPILDDTLKQDFYDALNAVQASLIRVDADELTYCLHIIVRFEIEKDIFEGNLAVDDLPREWNKKMQEYLGVVPPTNKMGVLQDVHWSMGAFGYFHTYAIGTMFSAQLFSALRKDVPDIDEQIRKGKFTSLHSWLGEKVWSKGRSLSAKELIKQATGKLPSADDYLAYLENKFT